MYINRCMSELKRRRKVEILNVKKSILKRISFVILILAIMPSIWFMTGLRYYYRDNDGNYAGAVILIGVLCLWCVLEYIKKKLPKYAYLCSYFVIVYSIWAELMMLYYKSRVYMLAYLLYLILLAIPFNKINKYGLQAGIAVLSVGSLFVYRYVNNFHEGLFTIGIHGGIVLFILAVIVINAIGWYLISMRDTCGKKSLGSFIVMLTCLVLDTSFTRRPLFLFAVIVMLMGVLEDEISIESDNVINNIRVCVKSVTKRKIRNGCISLLAVIIPFFVLGPLEIYAGNKNELTFPYYHFMIPLVCFSIIFTVLFGTFMSVIEDKLHGIICATVVAIGTVSWIQAMFFNQFIFDANGAGIDFSQLGQLSRKNLILWIALMVLLVIIYVIVSEKKPELRIHLWVAGMLSAIQMVAVISLLATVNPFPEAQWIFEGSDEWKVAKEDNVIVLILDSYGQESLEEAASEDDAFLDSLHDFTMYSDANSTYAGTFPSITYMFTEKEMPSDMDAAEYVNEAFSSEKYSEFMDRVHKKGYQIRYYIPDTNLFGRFANVDGKFDNATSIISNVKYKELITKMLKMSVYRYAPYILKPYFQVWTDEFFGGGIFYSDKWIWPACGNIEFYDYMERNGISFSENDKEIKIIHLFGLHRPYGTSAECKADSNATKRDNVYGLKLMVDTYLEELKKLGVYDKSTIIITSDHGGKSTENDIFPILLVKNSEEKHESIQLSNVPVDSKDFKATILQMIGDESYKDFGLALSDNTGETRNRVFFYNGNGGGFDYKRYEYSGNKNELLKVLENER